MDTANNEPEDGDERLNISEFELLGKRENPEGDEFGEVGDEVDPYAHLRDDQDDEAHVNEFGEEVGGMSKQQMLEKEAEIELQMKAMLDELEDEEYNKDPDQKEVIDQEDEDDQDEGLYGDEEGLNFENVGDGGEGIDDEEYEKLMGIENGDGDNTANNNQFGEVNPMDEDSELSDDAENDVFEEMREREVNNANNNDEQINQLEEKLLEDKPW